MSAMATGSNSAAAGDCARTRGAEPRTHPVATTTLLEARWRVGAHGTLAVSVAVAGPSPRGVASDADVVVTATLELAKPMTPRRLPALSAADTRGSSALPIQRRFEWTGTVAVESARDGSTELRTRLQPLDARLGHADGSDSETASSTQPGTVRVDCVFPVGAPPILLTDLPQAIGLRGGTYALSSLDAMRSEPQSSKGDRPALRS